MKKIFLTTVIFSVLFLIGCQEYSMVDPISTESIIKRQTTANKITTGLIPLEGLLVLPGGFQTYFTIEGQINYSHELVQLDPAPPAPQFFIALNLSVRADLTDEVNNTFRISSSSEDNIYVSLDGIYLLEKSFPVIGRNDGLVFVCRFHLTTDGIGLSSMWLAVPEATGVN